MQPTVTDINGIGPSTAKVLAEHGYNTPAALANASITEIVAVPGFSEKRAAAVKEAASILLNDSTVAETESPAEAVPVEKQPETGSKKKDKKKGKKKDKKKDSKKNKKGKKKK